MRVKRWMDMYGAARVTGVPPSYPDEEGFEVVPGEDPSVPVGLAVTANTEKFSGSTTSGERLNGECGLQGTKMSKPSISDELKRARELREHVSRVYVTDLAWCHAQGDADYAAEGFFIMKEAIDELTKMCHEANTRWWVDIRSGEPLSRNVGELLMLCVSELSEAMEGHRKDLMDDKLPNRPMIEVELADCLIRIFDLAGGLGLDLGGAFADKMAFNAMRADHKYENRLLPGGKKY